MNRMNQQEAARLFVETWRGRGYEKGETQPFWYQLLKDVFGIETPASFISFELPVQVKTTGFIDAFIPSTKVIIEQKSITKELDAETRQSDGSKLTPFQQAQRYVSGLEYSKYPRWIVTCNFKSFRIYDMEQPQAVPIEILLENLEREYYLLRFLVDDKTVAINREKQLSVQAGALVGKLYDELHAQYLNPDSPKSLHSLNILCVRLVFCLFAEKSFLFGNNRHAFHDYLSDFKPQQMRRGLQDLFDVLDTPEEDRDPYLDTTLAHFPYVNGGLFNKAEHLIIPRFTESIADLLLEECSAGFDWSGISPTIFGAIFEDTMNPETREDGSMHYTSVENIHKVIDPLFMNDLTREYSKIIQVKADRSRTKALIAFQEKLSCLRILDPACGSGNFLTETYLCLRRLENDVLQHIVGEEPSLHGDFSPIKVSIDQFYGLEVNEFAVAVAKAALWIAEAQMMMETEHIVQRHLDLFPLKSYSHIRQANALTMDWREIMDSQQLSFIIGNPPFKGKKSRQREQRDELVHLIGNDSAQPGNLDYVSGWFVQTARLLQESSAKAAFVSTINITRGEQVSLLWESLLDRYHMSIDFAWLPFIWNSESRKKAQVHCSVIGFSHNGDGRPKMLYAENAAPQLASNISPYLRDEETVLVSSRPRGPLCDVPETGIGNKPIDGGHFLFTPEQKEVFIAQEPLSKKYFYEWYGSEELIKGHRRYFLWLAKCPPSELRRMPLCKERIQLVRQVRSASSSASTRNLAASPTRFHVTNIPETDFIVIPEVTSENRDYIPMEFVVADSATRKLFSNLVKLMPNATLYHFGVLQSIVHMLWTKAICGYKDFRPRYSTDVVFNNFPWPKVSPEKMELIGKKAKGILQARANYPGCSLADLYDRDTMPDDLRKAHLDNDKAVLEAYGFTGEKESVIIQMLLQTYKNLSEHA